MPAGLSGLLRLGKGEHPLVMMCLPALGYLLLQRQCWNAERNVSSLHAETVVRVAFLQRVEGDCVKA